MQKPLLSLLFPLYRSCRFIENLRIQLSRVTDKHFEIIISDRHLEDNAIDLLEQEFGHDSRIRFVRVRDGINWVSHYNELVKMATGDYFCWVPHDDDYPQGYFNTLVQKLEAEPEAVMSFATMKTTGNSKWVNPGHELFTREVEYPYPAKHFVSLLFSGFLGIPFRGVFRRSVVVDNNLYIRQNEEVQTYQDIYWIFGMLQYGKYIYTEDTTCTKNFVTGSAHEGWKRETRIRNNEAARKLVYSYINDGGLPVPLQLRVRTLIWSYARYLNTVSRLPAQEK